ncbi:MAG: CHRD domain-containing protein [Chloroflexi bacterium]|nr:CHRD domain-containing protein [Chloroflexota bacterium]
MKHKLYRMAAVAAILTLVLSLSVGVAFAQQVSFSMNPLGGSGISGTATLEAVGNQTTVTVTLSGLAPGSERQGHFHTGTCANIGPIQIPLPNMVAGADGTGTVTATVNAPLASLQDGNHLIAFHTALAETPTLPGPTTTCGNVPTGAAPAPTPTPTPPDQLPRAGGFPIALIPVSAIGAALLGLGVFLRRR